MTSENKIPITPVDLGVETDKTPRALEGFAGAPAMRETPWQLPDKQVGAPDVFAEPPSVEKPGPTPHTFTLTVQVDPFWVEYLTKNADIFHPQYAGYWLRGVDCDDAIGWLCWETDDGSRVRHRQEPHREEALRAWRAGESLPAGWFRLDRAAALRAWEEGVKRWGVDWYEKTDAEREDVVIQLALLGEIRYG